MREAQMTNERAGWRSAVGATVAFLVASGLVHPAAASAASTCQGLLSLSLPQATVATAVAVPGPSFAAPNGATYQGLPPFCLVSIIATPTPDSLINISLWLPDTPGWNGRFEGTGNGGYGGTIAVSVPAMISGLKAGFAVASTDMGTAPSSNDDADVLVGHPEKWADFGWRATHLMTTLSKTVVGAFYGTAPRYSYFNGCSTGGQQALMEAEQFPDDYNGILRGDAAEDRTHVHTSVVWNYKALHASAQSLYTSGTEQDLTNAVLAACAVKSGGLASDPFLTDPRYCTYDPVALQCSSTLQTNCLSAAQVAAARLIYDGATDPATGALIFPGTVRGSESDSQFGWAGIESQAEPPFDSLFKWVFGLTWLWETYDFNQNMTEVDQVLAPVLNANSVNLAAFKDHGGKLLMYHGWADPLISPQDGIDYYLRLIATQGSNAA
jgi:feruloyl esterase